MSHVNTVLGICGLKLKTPLMNLCISGEEVTSEASVPALRNETTADRAELIALKLSPQSNKDVRKSRTSGTDACRGGLSRAAQKDNHLVQYVLYWLMVLGRQEAKIISVVFAETPPASRAFLISGKL